MRIVTFVVAVTTYHEKIIVVYNCVKHIVTDVKSGDAAFSSFCGTHD